jgi:hypothetical protein
VRALTVVALAACGSAAPVAQPPANHVVDSAAKTAEDVLGFLPADSDFVFGFDVGAFRASAIGHDMAPQLRQMMEHALEGAPFASCTAGWMDSVERVTLGMKVGEGDPSAILVIRGLDAPGALPCFERALRSKEQTVTSERGILIASAGRGSVAFAAAGAATLVLVIHGDTSLAAVAGVLAGGAPLRANDAFTGIYDHVHRGATVWGVGNGAAKWLAQQGIRASELDGNMVITDKIAIAGKMTTDSPATAANLAQSGQQTLPMLKQFFERIEIRPVAGTVVLDAAMTSEQLRTLLSQFGLF